MDTVAGDGAPDNRSAFKGVATISARDILGNKFTPNELADLHLDFKIGFQHPHQMHRDKITVVIGGEVPH